MRAIVIALEVDFLPVEVGFSEQCDRLWDAGFSIRSLHHCHRSPCVLRVILHAAEIRDSGQGREAIEMSSRNIHDVHGIDAGFRSQCQSVPAESIHVEIQVLGLRLRP